MLNSIYTLLHLPFQLWKASATWRCSICCLGHICVVHLLPVGNSVFNLFVSERLASSLYRVFLGSILWLLEYCTPFYKRSWFTSTGLCSWGKGDSQTELRNVWGPVTRPRSVLLNLGVLLRPHKDKDTIQGKALFANVAESQRILAFDISALKNSSRAIFICVGFRNQGKKICFWWVLTC